jgi:hypothetical protein
VVTVGKCCRVCIIFILSVQSLKLLTTDFCVVPIGMNALSCISMPHMDLQSKVLRHRGNFIETVRELGSLRYRGPEKKCFF